MLPLILFGAAYLIGRTTKETNEFADGGTTGAGSFADGGEVGQMSVAKSYWNKFDKKQKIDFLIGAGYSKSVANDLSSESWDSLEKGVHNDLRAVLMADGGMVRDEIRKFVIPYLKDEHNIEVDKSLNNGFNWFVPAISDELPDDFGLGPAINFQTSPAVCAMSLTVFATSAPALAATLLVTPLSCSV